MFKNKKISKFIFNLKYYKILESNLCYPFKIFEKNIIKFFMENLDLYLHKKIKIHNWKIYDDWMSLREYFFHPLQLHLPRNNFCCLLEKYFFIHFLISTLKNVLNFVRQFLFIFSFLMLPFQLKRKTKDGRNIFFLSWH
jgi:hypothetical protein